MKTLGKIIVLAVLVLGIAVVSVSAEPSETLTKIFEALTAEGSGYGKLKEMYKEYFPETEFSETLEDDGFTITISGNEYMDGTWKYVQDGDYLTVTTPADDLSASMFSIYVLEAVADCYGMDPHLVTRYITGLNANGFENKYYLYTTDEEAGTAVTSIYIAGPFEMKELDQIVLNDAVLDFEPLGEDYLSMASSAGKLMMVANGNVDGLTLLLGEHGGLDDLALESVVNVVRVLQPKGWETFVSEYKELADAETPDYMAELNVSRDAVSEIIDDASENDSFMIVRFGDQKR